MIAQGLVFGQRSTGDIRDEYFCVAMFMKESIIVCVGVVFFFDS